MHVLERARGWVGLRALAAVAFGVLVLSWPSLTLRTFYILFASFAIVAGLASLSTAWAARKERTLAGAQVLAGLVSIAAGVVAVSYPSITSLILLYVIAYGAISVGVLDGLSGLTRQRKAGGSALTVSGLVPIGFGIIALSLSSGGAVALVIPIGLYAISTGLAQFGLATDLMRNREAAVQPIRMRGTDQQEMERRAA